MPQFPLANAYWPAQTFTPLRESTIGSVLRDAAARVPDKVALIDGDPVPGNRRRWTYRALLADAERAARALLQRFSPGERIAVWSGNSPEWVILEFAAALAGLTLVTVNPAYQGDELAHVLGHSEADGLFMADEYQGADLHAILAERYQGGEYISVVQPPADGKLEPETLNDTNRLELSVHANDQHRQAVLVARLDNLGKGASGAAVQNIRLMLGLA